MFCSTFASSFLKYVINIVLFIHFLLMCNLEILAFACFRPYFKYVNHKSNFKYLSYKSALHKL